MTIVVCGDSFNAGIGCYDLDNEPYGSLLSAELSMPLINLAKGSSSNHGVFLQARYAASLPVAPNLVIISVTSYDRVEWLTEEARPPLSGLEAWHVNYHQYPPYNEHTTQPGVKALVNPFQGDKRYRGWMKTEQYGGIIEYLDNWAGKATGENYFSRLDGERLDRIETLRDYFMNCHEYEIKRDYDLGLMAFSLMMMERKSIPYLMICKDNRLTDFVPDRNVIKENWFELAKTYPDTLGTMHCSPAGHRYMRDVIMKKISDENLLDG